MKKTFKDSLIVFILVAGIISSFNILKHNYEETNLTDINIQSNIIQTEKQDETNIEEKQEDSNNMKIADNSITSDINSSTNIKHKNNSQEDTQKNNEEKPKESKKFVKTEKSVIEDNSSLPAGEDGTMIRLINETRVANGLNELNYDPILYSVTDIRLTEVSTCFSHTRPNGTPFYTVSKAVDGENLSKYGKGDASTSFKGFMNSQGHRENILYSKFTRVACKTVTINTIVYWIQLFGY